MDLKKVDKILVATTTVLKELAEFADKVTPPIRELLNEGSEDSLVEESDTPDLG